MNKRTFNRLLLSAAASSSGLPLSSPASAQPAPPAGVSLANWRNAPNNRRSFHHVEELLPVATVKRGTNTSTLDASARSLGGFSLQIPNGPQLGLDAVLAATSTDAMMVLLNGQVVHEFYGNGMSASSKHVLMSATKAVMGLLAGLLAQKGRLDVEAPVTKYVPEIGSGPYAGASVRHLLDMRAGIQFDEAQQTAYDEATGWESTQSGAASAGLHAFFTTLRGPAQSHGGGFRYVSANTDLLGWVIERALGQPVPALLSELLWAPLQVEQDAAITLDARGAPRCTGGLCATARDFARIGQLLVNKGRCGSTQVVPAVLIDDLAQNGDRMAWASGEWGAAFAPISKSMSYRSGWYTIDGTAQTLFAMGVYGQNLFVDRANGIVVAKFSSWAEPTDYRALGLTHMALGEIRRCLTDKAGGRA